MGQIMTQTTDKLQRFLRIIGLTEEERVIYLTLTQKGVNTPLELSRTTGVSRTQIYRILESMKTKGLIEDVIEEHRHLASAVDISELEPLVKQKETEANELTRMFPDIQQILKAEVGTNQADTKVLFFRGKQGLRQMVWHTLRATKEVVGYTYRRLEEYLGYDFMEDWHDSFIRKGLFMRDIFSDQYLETRKEYPPRLPFPKKHFEGRYIPKKLLDINLQMDIYNDVVAQYNWHEGEVFGVEIYNAKTAAFHKQLFEIVWNMGKAETT
jgi:sugar-specific transcriptional regulator TrmB